MRRSNLILSLFVLCALVTLSQADFSGRRVEMETDFDLTRIPENFRELKIASLLKEEEELCLHLALKQNNLPQIHELLERVSNPSSLDYGNYLSWDELRQLIQPSNEVYDIIEEWLGNDVTYQVVSETKDWMRVYMTVKQAEELLDVKFKKFINLQNPRMSVFRAVNKHYSVPIEVANVIDLIGGVHGFYFLSPKSISITNRDDRASFSAAVTPSVVKQYSKSVGVTGTNSNNSMAVAQFLEQYYSPSDLTDYQQYFKLLVQPVTQEIGPNYQQFPGAEATLDIQSIMGAAQNVSAWFVSTGGRFEGQEPFLTWIQDMESIDSPYVHSVSYGDVESSISFSYAERCDTEFEKFGLTGRTILFASGDDGVGCSSCSSGNPVLEPNWPASSTFVTAVGGFYLTPSGDLVGDTIASGGFSNYFSQPSYQADVVANYLSNPNNLPPANEVYNTTGRGIPDISGFSENVEIYFNGGLIGIGGTSCASPITAGLFALVNDALLTANLPTLGYANPLIYQVAQSNPLTFTDITSGENDNSCCTGFKASTGWDPETGFGFPNYQELVKEVTSTMTRAVQRRATLSHRF